MLEFSGVLHLPMMCGHVTYSETSCRSTACMFQDVFMSLDRILFEKNMPICNKDEIIYNMIQ